MNKSNNKFMFNITAAQRIIKADEGILEEAHEYNYLGQIIHTETSHEKEIRRRISLEWAVLNKYGDVVKSKLPVCLKRKI